MFEKVRAVIKEQNSAADKLRAVFRYFESYITSPPIKGGCPLLNVAVESDDANPTLRKEALRILTILRESLLHILKKGVEHRQIKSGVDKELYATLIMASLEGAIMMSKLTGNSEDIKRVVQHLEKLITEIEL